MRKWIVLIAVMMAFAAPHESVGASGRVQEENGLITLVSPSENVITEQSRIIFRGTADAEILTINGERIELASDGQFIYRADLTRANDYNLFVIQAKKGTQLDTVNRRIFYKPLVTAETGTLSILRPADMALVGDQTVTFQGQSANLRRIVVNNRVVTPNQAGAFIVTLPLVPTTTPQLFEFRGTGTDGREVTVVRRVVYNGSVPSVTVLPNLTNEANTPVSVNNQIPSKVVASKTASVAPRGEFTVLFPPDQYISHRDLIYIKGIARGADFVSINGVKVVVNPAGRFFYKPILTLPNAYNTFVLEAFIDGKTHKRTLNVYYKKPVKDLVSLPSAAMVATASAVMTENAAPETVLPPKPVVTILNPRTNFVTYEDHVVIEGEAHHVTEVFANNKVVKPDEKTGRFSLRFPLEQVGRYVFNVYALGEGGQQASDVVKVYRVSTSVTKDEVDMAEDLEKKLNSRVSLELSDANIRDVLRVLADKSGLNIVSDTTLSGTVSIMVKDVPIRNAISYVLDSQGLSYKIEGNTIIVATAENLRTPSSLATRVFRLNNIDSMVAADILSKYVTPEEKVQALKKDNLLIVNAGADKLEYIAALIQKIDSEKTPQIVVEAQIIEASLSDLESFGISWPQSIGVAAEISAGSEEVFTVKSAFTTFINMLETAGKARILAKPRLNALNEQEAEIFIGDRVPIIEQTLDTSGRITETVTFVDTGITLRILPDINTQENTMKLKLEPEVSVVSSFKGANNDKPVIKTRKVSTTVSVRDGETVVIGGLFSSTETDTQSKVPVLGDIPLLGALFSSTRLDTEKTELIIAVTPRIVTDLPKIDAAAK